MRRWMRIAGWSGAGLAVVAALSGARLVTQPATHLEHSLVVRGPAQVVSPSGRLPRSLAQYVQAGDATSFAELVNGAYWGGRHKKARRSARGSARPTVDMSIEAIHDAAEFNPLWAGRNGAVVARILNLGAFSDSAYSTTPGPGLEYYLVVHQPLQGHVGGYPAPWSLVELNTNTSPAQIVIRKTGDRFVPCAPFHVPGASRAIFDGCLREGTTIRMAGIMLLPAMLLRRLQGSLDNVSCDQGCCSNPS